MKGGQWGRTLRRRSWTYKSVARGLEKVERRRRVLLSISNSLYGKLEVLHREMEFLLLYLGRLATRGNGRETGIYIFIAC